METRIRQQNSGIYVIDEQVIPISKHWASGSYITWPEMFAKRETAQKFLDKQNKLTSP